MRQDILTKGTIDRRTGGTITYKMERGTAGDLIFLLGKSTFNAKDIITIKLRHAGGVDMVVDRVPAFLLAQLCDLKRGRPNFGQVNFAGGLGEEQTAPVVINSGEYYQLNAFKVKIGHISLQDAKSELEITVDLAKAFGSYCTLKIANIEPTSSPDYLLQYDKSFDLESTHWLVREVYLYNKTFASFFNQTNDTAKETTGKDISMMLYTDSDAYETDIEVLGATTSIDGELAHSVNNVVCAYTDNEALPTPSLRLKITGEDSKEVGLLIIKEKMIQTLTSVSTIAQVDKALVKTEAIEKMGNNIAKAYRHAGSTRPSAELAQIKAEVTSKTPEAV